jgi:antitoxin component of MazEF toxin-antitoxin module
MFCLWGILMPKIQKTGHSHWVSIPAQICKLKSWHKGQELMFNIDQRTGKVILDKIEDMA